MSEQSSSREFSPIERQIRDVFHAQEFVPEAIGRYRVDARLGSGGMGTVFRGTDERLDRAVAVKLIRRDLLAEPTAVARFLREARAAAQVDHPFVCPLLDAGDSEFGPYLVMKLIEGETLDRWIAGLGPRRDSEVVGRIVETASKLAHALHAIHSAGVVHRDVKPRNVLVTRSGDPVLVDFGVAWAAESGTLTGDLQPGTLPYMAPEQLAGRRANARSDIYALAVTLYECLTGRLPNDAETPLELFTILRDHDITSIQSTNPVVPRNVEEVCVRAMAFEPMDRHESGLELAEELDRAIAGAPVHRLPRLRRRGTRRLARRTLLGLGVLVAGIATTAALIDYVRLRRGIRDVADMFLDPNVRKGLDPIAYQRLSKRLEELDRSSPSMRIARAIAPVGAIHSSSTISFAFVLDEGALDPGASAAVELTDRRSHAVTRHVLAPAASSRQTFDWPHSLSPGRYEWRVVAGAIEILDATAFEIVSATDFRQLLDSVPTTGEPSIDRLLRADRLVDRGLATDAIRELSVSDWRTRPDDERAVHSHLLARARLRAGDVRAARAALASSPFSAGGR